MTVMFLLALPFLLSQVWADPAGCDQFQAVTCVLSEENIVGYSRENLTQTCQDRCKDSAECQYFTHYQQQCYLLLSCQIHQDCQECVSGPTQPSFSSCPWPPSPTDPPTTTSTSTPASCQEYLVDLQCDLDELNVIETLHSPSIGDCQVRSRDERSIIIDL